MDLPDNDDALRAANTRYGLKTLYNLIELGNELAALVVEQARANPAEATAAQATISFERVARTIRRAILVTHKLLEPVKHPAEPKPGRPGPHRPHKPSELDRIDRLELPDDPAEWTDAELIHQQCQHLGIAALPGAPPLHCLPLADFGTLRERLKAAVNLLGVTFARPAPPD